jgi:hypothetical protein
MEFVAEFGLLSGTNFPARRDIAVNSDKPGVISFSISIQNCQKIANLTTIVLPGPIVNSVNTPRR